MFLRGNSHCSSQRVQELQLVLLSVCILFARHKKEEEPARLPVFFLRNFYRKSFVKRPVDLEVCSIVLSQPPFQHPGSQVLQH